MSILEGMSDLFNWALDTFVPNQEQLGSVVRWGAGIAGAWAIQNGWIDDDQAVMLAGVAAAMVPLVWSIIIKTRAAQIKSAAKVPGVTVVVSPGAPPVVQQLAKDDRLPNIIPERI